MLLLNFANAFFNAGATCALHRNPSSNLCERGRSQDCASTKTGFSASSKQWSHSKLSKSKGPLKDKAAWYSLLPHALSCWNHVYWFAFFPLDMTSTHLWPNLAPTEHKGLCWFSRLFPTAGSRLCQLLLPAWYWQVTQIPLFQISTFSRRAVKTAPTRWLISKTLPPITIIAAMIPEWAY